MLYEDSKAMREDCWRYGRENELVESSWGGGVMRAGLYKLLSSAQ